MVWLGRLPHDLAGGRKCLSVRAIPGGSTETGRLDDAPEFLDGRAGAQITAAENA
ncbi:hypothetical protein ABIE69_003224 [Rhodobacteraceae bacterium MBR-64]|jgi:hypothetical protein